MAISTTEKLLFNKAFTDPKFGRGLFNELPLDSFSGEAKELTQIIKRHYLTNTNAMTEREVEIYIEKRYDLDDPKGLEKALETKQLVTDSYDIADEVSNEVATDTLNEHVREILSANAIMRTVDEGKLADGDTVRSLGMELVNIALLDVNNSQDDNFLDVINDTDRKTDLYNELRRTTYPTGFSNIDNMLDGGGIGRGEVALLVAPTGTGKTTFGVQAAINNVMEGLNVLYVTLEERLGRMALNMDMAMFGTGQSTFYNEHTLANKELIEQAKEYLNTNFPNIGNLYISKHEPRELTVEGLEQVILDTKIKKGIAVDVVVIDYPALLKTEHAADSNQESNIGGQTFERIRGLSQKHDFVCYTLAQTNRNANQQAIITMYDIEGSKKVLNACELVLTLNRNQEEYQNQYIRMHVDKVRNRKQGSTPPEMLSFRIDLDGYTIRPTTEQEQVEHQRLLDESDGYTPRDNVSKGQDRADQINKIVGG